MKRLISGILALTFVLSLCINPVHAEEIYPEQQLIRQGDIIPQNVAELLAEMFVQSNVDSDMETIWSTGTKVCSTVTLYDETGLPSAYSVELETDGRSTGYIVISAYPDMENYILEYADKENPLYEKFKPEDTEQIVYTGNLQYYQETENHTLIDLEGQKVSAENITNIFHAVRDEEEIDETKSLVQSLLAESQPKLSLFASSPKEPEPIENPLQYIEKIYGGSAYNEAYEWKTLESAVRHRTTNTFTRKNSGNNYSPVTAITNVIEITGNLRNTSKIKSTGIQTIFSDVEQIGLAGKNGYSNYFWKADGNYVAGCVGDWAKQALAKYGVSIRCSQMGNFQYPQIKYEIDKSRPFLLSTGTYGNYKSQVVTAYAYTRFQNKESKNFKTFIKVADGHATSGRYIDLITIVDRKITDVELFTIEY